MATITGKASEFITFSRTSNATLVDSDGKIKWAPHNLLLASEQFDAASWNKYLATVSANTQAAPNGTTTADTVTASAGNDVHRVQRAGDVAIGASANCSLSIFVKAGTHNFVTIGFYSASEVFVSATFNLASGSAATETDVGTTSGTIVSTEKVDVGTGWYRLTITGNYSGSAALSFVNFAQAATGNSYTNFGQPVANLVGTETFHLWGAHLYRSDLGGMKANTSAYPLYNPTTPKNLLGYSEDYSGTGWARASISATANAAISPNGLLTADKLVPANGASSGNIYNNPGTTIVSGGTYTASVYVKAAELGFAYISLNARASSSAQGVCVNLTTGARSNEGVSGTYSVVDAGNGWWRVSCTGVSNTTSGYLEVFPLASAGSFNSYTGNGTSGIYAWGAQLSDSASLDTYVPNYGAAPTAAAYYGPRLDYDPVTLAAKGLLVEELRTNTILNSSVFSGWTAANATVLDNQVAGPDGTITAGIITATAANGERYVQVTSTSGVAHTGSVYVKRKTGTGSVYLVDAAGGRSLVTSSITTGSWTRISVTANSVSVNPFFGIRLATSGDELYIWGAQLEAGSFATSYIPVGATTAGATRNADVASVSTSQFPYSATEGTLVVAYNRPTAPSATQVALAFGPVAAGSLVSAGGDSTTGWYASGVVPTGVVNGTNKVGIAFNSTGAFAAVANGGTAASSSASDWTGTSTSLNIGNRSDNIRNINGHIRQITYLPRRISNAELIARSS